MWSMWLSVAVVTLSLVAAQQNSDWTDDSRKATEQGSFASTSAPNAQFQETSPVPQASSFDNGKRTTRQQIRSVAVTDDREDRVESHVFPGLMVPRDVKEALETLLSKETVAWLDRQEAAGKEVVNLEGQVIPEDMKDLIRNYVQSQDKDDKPNERTPTMETPHVRNAGTKSAHPSGNKHRPLNADRRKHPSIGSVAENWFKSVAMSLWKRGVVTRVVLTLVVMSTIGAVLFVYGVSDIWAAVIQTTTLRRQSKRIEVQCEVHSPEDKTSTKPHPKSGGRSKSKETSSKSGSKKRSKSVASRSRSEHIEIKRETPQGKSTKGRTVGEPSEEDENNDWQEVMHNKPKCRSRSKHNQEDDSYPAASKAASRPTTPKTPPQSTSSPLPNPKNEETTSQVTPIKTHQSTMKRESRTGDEAKTALQLTMTSSGAFSDEKSPSGFDLSGLSNESYVLQSPVQQSPFAASTDVPFFTSSPIRGGYPSSEQQFQSKVDCLLRNLRNKPFTMHPVSSTPHLRRSITDQEDRMYVPRMGMSMQPSFSGNLDPMLSSSGMLNNRLMYSEEGCLMRQFSAGLPPTRSNRMRQRAGSLPLTQSQSHALYTPGQGGMNGFQGHGLSNNCSLFSSNPSIWSVDLAVDRDLVKSSMTNGSNSRRPPTNESFDFKRCLPDQLLSEMGSPDPYT